MPKGLENTIIVLERNLTYTVKHEFEGEYRNITENIINPHEAILVVDAYRNGFSDGLFEANRNFSEMCAKCEK